MANEARLENAAAAEAAAAVRGSPSGDSFASLPLEVVSVTNCDGPTSPHSIKVEHIIVNGCLM